MAEHVLRLVPKKHDGEPEHEERADDPVLHERQRQHALVAEDLPELFVADLRERRVHHQHEADGYRDRGRPHAALVEHDREARRKEAEGDAEGHRREDPERQMAIEE